MASLLARYERDPVLRKDPAFKWHRLPTWLGLRVEVEEEQMDQWAIEMQQRLLGFFESLRNFSEMRVEVICRSSRCLLRIIDTMAALARTEEIEAGTATYRTEDAGFNAVMWKLVNEPWFKTSFNLNITNLRVPMDARNEFRVISLLRIRNAN